VHLAGVVSDWREHGLIRLGDPQRAAVQFFDSVGGDLHRRAIAGIIPKNLCAAIERSIDHAVQIFWNGIRVD
jgi:AefR-like transcriptional repressor, C-terminal domain